MIPLARPSIGDEEERAVLDALRSGHLVQGPRVADFETACATYLGAEHAVAVSSCTAALHMALLALDLPPGSEVAVPAFSWPATANAVVLAGLAPVFVDIEPVTFGADVSCLREFGREVSAIVVVHAFGRMADVRAIAQVAAELGVPMIEDAACAFGARVAGRDAGTFGRVGCFSFHPRKALTTGEGGLLVTPDPGLADRFRSLRNHGLDDDREFVLPGFNYRMTEFQAALGRVQVERFPELLAGRRRMAVRYGELLADVPVETPDLGAGEEHAVQSYVVLLPAALADQRAAIIEAMRAAGVETTIGTIHIPLTRYYAQRGGHRPGDFPTTDDVAARSMSLPVFDGLTDGDQEQVVGALARAIEVVGGV